MILTDKSIVKLWYSGERDNTNCQSEIHGIILIYFYFTTNLLGKSDSVANVVAFSISFVMSFECLMVLTSKNGRFLSTSKMSKS